MASHSSTLAWKSQGWSSLIDCSPWGRYESDTTGRLHFHSSLACIGEGNGNPLQCSCLENPRDRGACWATVYGVAQSQTWLNRLSSSSSKVNIYKLLFFYFIFTRKLLISHFSVVHVILSNMKICKIILHLWFIYSLRTMKIKKLLLSFCPWQTKVIM